MLLSVRDWNDVFRLPIVWLIAALVGYLFVSSYWSDPFIWREVFSIFIRALLALVFLFMVAFAECQLRRQLWRWLRRAMAIAALLAVLAAMWVYFDDPPVDGRLNGLGQLAPKSLRRWCTACACSSCLY